MKKINEILRNFGQSKDDEFVSSDVKKQFEMRIERIKNAISLKIPDRIPLVPDPGFFPFIYSGISLKEAMYDSNKAYTAWIKTITAFEWDATMPPYTYSAAVFDILGYKQLLWPGHGLVDDATTYQFVEPDQTIKNQIWYTAMKPEDYDWFLDDPSDYLIRAYLPRIFETLKPFSSLPPMHGIISWYQGLFEALSTANIEKSFQALTNASREAAKWLESFVGFTCNMKKIGFPLLSLSATHAPFDYIANFLRGTKGAFMDMFQRPEKLQKACERITPWMIEAGVTGAKIMGNPTVSIFLHKGAFLNIEQFEKFYWPSLKNVIQGLIDNNLVPYVFTEGNYNPYFHIIKNVPKGRLIYHVEKDIFKAKEVLDGHVCLTGGPPNSLLITANPRLVIKYCKKIIEKVGEGGGFMMGAAAPIINADPLNIKAVTDAIQEYGWYKK